MTQSEFNNIEENDKLGKLSLNGECTRYRKKGNENIFLYQISSFYVKVSDGIDGTF
jgi:hypothetical protein